MHILRKLNIWSIDVALAAGLLTIAFAHLWKIELPLTVPVLLALTVWLIYTFDHIRDARETRAPGLSIRRNLHRKYLRSLISISVVLLILMAILVFMVPVNVVVYGASLACLVAAYYLGLHFLKRKMALRKEFVVAVLYSAGIVLGPLSVGPAPPGFQVHLIQLFMLALNNLLLFSWFDREIDAKEGFDTIFHAMSNRTAKRLLIILPLVQVAVAAFLVLYGFYPQFETVWLFTSLLMLVPVIRPVFWQQGARYRVLGDLLFFMPSLILLVL